MTSFRILGPIEAWGAERQVSVGGPRQLALLAFLLLHANRAVPSDALIEALWGSARPAADNRLQMAVARLRKALAPLNGPAGSRVRTVSGGYLLSVGPDELDAELFTKRLHEGLRALEGGSPAQAVTSLREALDLWRGPPLAEVAFVDFAQGEIRRLEELRLAALEARIDADLQLGRHRELIGELEALRAEHPIRERISAQLMLALYRSGRQADALEIYQLTRAELAGQLGLEPGPRLKELQAEILEQAPALGSSPANGSTTRAPSPGSERRPEPVPAPLPARLEPYGPAVFADRLAEHELILRALTEAASSGRRAAFVTGEPGIGKTRLISEVADEAHATGTLVLAGRCDEGLDIPYQPFVEALEHLVEHAPIDLLRDHIARYGDSLARLVPSLGARVLGAPVVMPPASESERYVLFGAVEGLLAATCERAPLLLVLEDLHWAELPTLKLLRRLLSSPRQPRLMVLCTCRVQDLTEEHPLREVLADVHREPHALRIDLRGLEVDAVADLLKGVADRPAESADEQLVLALGAAADGNPFFITELVRSLVETGALANEGGHWRLSPGVDPAAQLPPSIAETLAQRVRRMGDEVRRTLQVASVLGYEFDLDLVSELLDADPSADAFDRAIERGVLLEVPGRPARLRFAHALMQRYLYRELGAARRAALHRQVAGAMEAQLERGRWPLAEVARHWLAAGGADADRAFRYAVRAGDEALGKLAPDEARRWYQISLELLARQSDPDLGEVCELMLKRGEAERQAGDPGFRETLLEAAGLAERIGDERGLVRAALANSRGMQSETGVVDEARIATLGAALKVLPSGDSPERARLLAMQAAELMYSGEWERRTRLSDEAVAIARRLNDPDALSAVLNMRFVTLLAAHSHAERRANTVEAVEAAERLSDPIAQFFAYHWRGYALIEDGDIAAASAWMQREQEIAERFRLPTALWLARAGEANLAIVAGKLEMADRLAADAFELGRHSEPDALACYAAQRTSIAFESGRLAEMIPMLEQAVQDNPGVPGFRATLALALTDAHRLGEAQRILERESVLGFDAMPRDVAWLAVTCIYAHVSVRLEYLPAIGTLYELLEPWAEQIAFPAFGVWGPVALYLGSLALAVENFDEAEHHLTGAALAASRAQAPIWAERAAGQLARLSANTE